ncbi:hypothetical protein ABPG72_019568 [Tetrahymena utriculariae]
MVRLVAEDFCNFYYAEFCSRASIVCILLMCLTFLAPFYLSFTTDYFWLNIKVNQEQPNTQIIQAYLLSSSATYQINTLQINPIWKDKKIGELNIERVDEYEINFSVSNVPNTQQIIEIILEMDYMLTDVSQLKSRQLLFLSFMAGYNFDNVQFYGQINYDQQSPLYCNGQNSLQYKQPLYNEDRLYNYMRSNMFYKNQTASLKYEYFTQMLLSQNAAGTRTVQVTGRIHIPKYQNVLYIPSIAETLKFQWAAYFSILVVLLYLFRMILKQMYRHSVFPVSVMDNLPQKAFRQFGKQKQE